jgi:hypothetical protein
MSWSEPEGQSGRAMATWSLLTASPITITVVSPEDTAKDMCPGVCPAVATAVTPGATSAPSSKVSSIPSMTSILRMAPAAKLARASPMVFTVSGSIQ